MGIWTPFGWLSAGEHENMIIGMQELMREVRVLEDYIRACQAGDAFRSVPLTREEVEVIASYRRFVDEHQDHAQM